MEIPDGAKKEAQIKYNKKIQDVLTGILPVFQDHNLTVNDINNVVKLLQSEISNSVAVIELNHLMGKTDKISK